MRRNVAGVGILGDRAGFTTARTGINGRASDSKVRFIVMA
jgi:hypothetical protein